MSDTRRSCVAHVCRHKGVPYAKVQPLEAHLCNVADLTEIFATKAGVPLAGRLILMLHDIGKYSDEFQEYILSAD